MLDPAYERSDNPLVYNKNLTPHALITATAPDRHAAMRAPSRPGLLCLSLAMLLLCVLLLPQRAFSQQQYLISPGDILKFTVFKNADLSVEVRVSEQGSISYPLIGNVAVGGLT